MMQAIQAAQAVRFLFDVDPFPEGSEMDVHWP